MAWTDRLGWGHRALAGAPGEPSISTWLGYLEGEEVGYAELARIGGDVEIARSASSPASPAAAWAARCWRRSTEAAWDDGAERVWLHTCSLDSPAALPAYEARGFRRYDERTGR